MFPAPAPCVAEGARRPARVAGQAEITPAAVEFRLPGDESLFAQELLDLLDRGVLGWEEQVGVFQ
jgi:hypothetical protein